MGTRSRYTRSFVRLLARARAVRLHEAPARSRMPCRAAQYRSVGRLCKVTSGTACCETFAKRCVDKQNVVATELYTVFAAWLAAGGPRHHR